jgi:hypothetical protein
MESEASGGNQQTKAGSQAGIVETSGGNEPDDGRRSSSECSEKAAQAVHIAPSRIDFINNRFVYYIYPILERGACGSRRAESMT